MANGVKVGTAYIEITGDVSGLGPGIDDSLDKAAKRAGPAGKKIGKELSGGVKDAIKDIGDDFKTAGRDWGRGISDGLKNVDVKGVFSDIRKGIDDVTSGASNMGSALGGGGGGSVADILNKIGTAGQNLKQSDIMGTLSAVSGGLRDIGQGDTAGKLDAIQQKFSTLQGDIKGTTDQLMTLSSNSGRISGGLTQIANAAGPLALVFTTLTTLMPGFNDALNKIQNGQGGIKDWANVLAPGTNLIDQVLAAMGLAPKGDSAPTHGPPTSPSAGMSPWDYAHASTGGTGYGSGAPGFPTTGAGTVGGAYVPGLGLAGAADTPRRGGQNNAVISGAPRGALTNPPPDENSIRQWAQTMFGIPNTFGTGSWENAAHDYDGKLHHPGGAKQGYAFDFHGTSEQMSALANYVATNYAGQTLELIYQGKGFDSSRLIKNGKFGDVYGPDLLAQHRTHVHWATDIMPQIPSFDEGGAFEPGDEYDYDSDSWKPPGWRTAKKHKWDNTGQFDPRILLDSMAFATDITDFPNAPKDIQLRPDPGKRYTTGIQIPRDLASDRSAADIPLPRLGFPYEDNYESGGDTDTGLAMLHAGEHVLTADDVAALGGQQGVYAMRDSLHNQNTQDAGNGQDDPWAQVARTLGYLPAAGQGAGVAGTSSLSRLWGLGNEAVAGAIDTGASMAQMAANVGLTAAGAGPGAGAAAGFGIQMGASEAKLAASFGFQVGSILTDAAVEQLFPFGAPRWIGYDYTQFVPQLDISQVGVTTGEKAINAAMGGQPHGAGGEAPGPGGPGGPVDPGHMVGNQPVGAPTPALGATPPSAPPATAPSGPVLGPPPAVSAIPGAGSLIQGNTGGLNSDNIVGPPPPGSPLATLFGMDEGGWLPNNAMALNTSGRPELMVPHNQLDSMGISPAAKQHGGDTYYITGLNADEVMRKVDQKQRLNRMRYGNRYPGG